MTVAPSSLGTPRITAVLPSTSMSAPRRRSSCTCMKRFSKIVSVTVDVPSATQFRVMNCACMSVGNAGYGAVRRPTARGRPRMRRRMRSSSVSISAPASRSFASTASSVSGRAPVNVTSPPVAAAATRNVPVSIRSGITGYVAPCSCSTPWIVMMSVPAPSTFAPIAFRQFARSTTSGSRAAFSMTVVPSARQAAIMRFSVPVTVTRSITRRVPFRRFERAWTYPCSIVISAPSACRPLMCRSTGRIPIAQPPGSDTRASPNRATSGPSTRIDARIVLTRS